MERARHALCLVAVHFMLVWSYKYDNITSIPQRQLLEFSLEHKKPIGLLTLGSGEPVEIRDTISINSDLFKNEHFFDIQSHLDGERIPIRIVAAKGIGVWGHFEVTHDVSKYTKADVFNGIGKKTTAFVRFAVNSEGSSGTDLGRDIKDMSVKLYTKEGILDFLNINLPQFTFKDPVEFSSFIHTFSRRNPKTHLPDSNMELDIVLQRPSAWSVFLFFYSDFGVPNGWRHADFFPQHTYELVYKHNERWYVRFSWRTEQGTDYLTAKQIRQINDPEYYIRDMYTAIYNKTFPSWRLEMDIMSIHDIQTVDFNPFDVTRRWDYGTYHTVPIGRMVLTEFSENQHRDAELSAFSPANLVPGIPGPVDTLFRGRRFAYRDTQNYRISRNHLKVGVNSPKYAKSYVRDGHPPVDDNGRDSPIYYPNSFNGPIPYVDDERPKEHLQVLESNAIDLQIAADFYNKVIPDDIGRQHLVDNLVELLSTQIVAPLRKRAIKLMTLTDKDLARRVILGLQARHVPSGYKIEYDERD